MFPDASYATPLTTDAGFETFSGREAPAPRALGWGWRHLLTALLLVVTVPVFAVTAVACLPVLLVVGASEGLRKLLPALRR